MFITDFHRVSTFVWFCRRTCYKQYCLVEKKETKKNLEDKVQLLLKRYKANDVARKTGDEEGRVKALEYSLYIANLLCNS